MYTKSGPSCEEVAMLQVAPSGFLPSSDRVRKQELTLVAIFFLTIRGRRISHTGPLNVNNAHSILQPCRWNVDLKHYNSVFFLTLLSTSPEHVTSTVCVSWTWRRKKKTKQTQRQTYCVVHDAGVKHLKGVIQINTIDSPFFWKERKEKRPGNSEVRKQTNPKSSKEVEHKTNL